MALVPEMPAPFTLELKPALPMAALGELIVGVVGLIVTPVELLEPDVPVAPIGRVVVTLVPEMPAPIKLELKSALPMAALGELIVGDRARRSARLCLSISPHGRAS